MSINLQATSWHKDNGLWQWIIQFMFSALSFPCVCQSIWNVSSLWSGVSYGLIQCNNSIYYHPKESTFFGNESKYQTIMYSSRMRTARLLTVSRSIREGVCLGGVCLGVACLGGCLPRWGVCPGGVCIPACNGADTPPPTVERMTDGCKNITPKTFAGGN